MLSGFNTANSAFLISIRQSATIQEQQQSTNQMPLLGPIIIPNLPQQSEIAINGGTNAKSISNMIDNNAIDPYVHTMQRCADDLSGVKRQQRCVMCINEQRRTMTSYYCSLCCITAIREEERKPSKHAYCINSKYNCFSRHIAKCYRHMNVTGRVALQRKDISEGNKANMNSSQATIPIAGRVVSRKIPKKKKSHRKRR